MKNKIYLCAISNVQSGICNEDCKFCTQSVRYKANIQRYKIKDIQDILYEAKLAKQNKAIGFCLVTAGKGITPDILDYISNAAKQIKKLKLNINIIACNGTATLEQLQILKQAGVDSYNHNLETSKDFYKNICTTHTWEERFQTCQNVKKAGLNLVCGGIFGLGETQQDRISMINAIVSLNPVTIPINFFHPNPALPLKQNTLTKQEAFELIRLVKDMAPTVHKIMVAGGRELIFGDNQYEIFKYGANSIVIGDYLTTKGNQADKDIIYLENSGFDIASSCN